ncbi:prepilin-type N-terminal cleavage/methylation domain-containing protein [Patescibacteria group bacterium]|nr:prepilin-type N-terminal cleavage/methylation domain-containing protein [Patescibacteria group bacterium]MBU1868548.1 prepilin-type N-terminal cleavage/methylation domain-containing protein [Patescibacteria group bacterium]
MKQERGFTLIEFLVTVAVMAVVAVYFIPQYTSFTKRQKLKTQGEELATHIKSARNKALSSVQGTSDPVVNYGVMYFTDLNSTGIFRKVDRGTVQEWESEAVEQLTILPEVKVYWPAVDVIFHVPTGGLVGGDKAITICYDNIGQYQINVLATGVISLGDRQDVGSCP